MAATWRLECQTCRWIGFADTRDDATRMAREHADGAREKVHAVTIEPRPDPTR
jgi:hypothetical protein